MSHLIYPKPRLDALSDAIFGVAMTLLVLELNIPAEFEPQSSAELGGALLGLLPKFLPYVLSFGVLGLRWLSNVQMRHKAETVSRSYGQWWLIYHLLVTTVPFSTMVISRYIQLPPAVWLYSANTLLMALVSLRLLALTEVESRDSVVERIIVLWVLAGSSLLAFGLSFVSSTLAMWAFAINFLQPVFSRWIAHRRT